VCDLETSRIGAPYIYDISNLRVNVNFSVNFKIGFKTIHLCISWCIKNFDNVLTKLSDKLKIYFALHILWYFCDFVYVLTLALHLWHV
jgi:hypothetical protein